MCLHNILLKRLGVWLMGLLNHIRSQEQNISTKALWGTFLSNCMDLCYICERTKRCLRILYQQRHYHLGLKWTETEWNKRRLSHSQILQAGNRLKKFLICKHVQPFKKKRWLQRGSLGLKGHIFGQKKADLWCQRPDLWAQRWYLPVVTWAGISLSLRTLLVAFRNHPDIPESSHHLKILTILHPQKLYHIR